MALTPTASSQSASILNTTSTTTDIPAKLLDWTDEQQALLSAKVRKSPELNLSAKKVMDAVKEYPKVLNLNSHSIATVYPTHLNGEDQTTYPTEMFEKLKDAPDELKVILYPSVIGILAYQISFTEAELDSQDRFYLFLNLILEILTKTNEEHLDALLNAVAEVVRPDDQVELQHTPMCKTQISDIEDAVAASTNSGCLGCNNKCSTINANAEFPIVALKDLIDSIAE